MYPHVCMLHDHQACVEKFHYVKQQLTASFTSGVLIESWNTKQEEGNKAKNPAMKTGNSCILAEYRLTAYFGKQLDGASPIRP